ncbi:hypothetical protein F4811DRAFT_233364 [Daldinia bambusicola]|nr:hypothetical protein F4811DRAFT_233364 [Daldinia bambusicola]
MCEVLLLGRVRLFFLCILVLLYSGHCFETTRYHAYIFEFMGCEPLLGIHSERRIYRGSLPLVRFVFVRGVGQVVHQYTSLLYNFTVSLLFLSYTQRHLNLCVQFEAKRRPSCRFFGQPQLEYICTPHPVSSYPLPLCSHNRPRLLSVISLTSLQTPYLVSRPDMEKP